MKSWNPGGPAELTKNLVSFAGTFLWIQKIRGPKKEAHAGECSSQASYRKILKVFLSHLGFTPMASVKDIGGSWVASTDPSTGRTYYANTVSKEVSWEWPAGVPHPDGSGHVFEEVAQGNEWVATLDEGSGQHYYHNRITGETTWTQPEGFLHDHEKRSPTLPATAELTEDDDPNANPDNWISKDDPSSGMTYYHNRASGETTWSKPRCLDSDQSDVPDDYSAPDASGESTIIDDALGGTTESKLSALREMMIEDESAPAPSSSAIGSSASLGAASVVPKVQEKEGEHTSTAKPTNGLHEGAISDVAAAALDVDSTRAMPAVAMLEKFTDLHPDGSKIVTAEALRPLENIRFVEFAETNYNFMRKGMLGFKTTTQKITSWKGGKDCIKTSLLNLNDKELVSEAVQCFRNITGWMGDRGSGKDPTSHCLKLLSNMLQSVDNLRNEIYCQLCKQTTNNNETTNKDQPMSNILGWQLMVICVACFPPGPLLKDYLSAHCKVRASFIGLFLRPCACVAHSLLERERGGAGEEGREREM